MNYRASSLGPSDSTSQLVRPTDFELEAAVEKLLNLVEPPILCPRYLPKSVLWDYEDSNNAADCVLLTEANKCQLKMNLAIHRNDVTNISNQEYCSGSISALRTGKV